MDEFTAEFFENSSCRWRQNKKRVSEGSFVYVCGAPLPKDRYCQCRIMQNAIKIEPCWRHKTSSL